MSIVQAELYEALIAAGAPEDKARAAATVAAITTNHPKPEELATKDYIEKRVAELEGKIAELKIKITGHEIEIVGLGGGMDSEMTKPEDRLIRQSKKSDRMIIAAIVVATGVILAAIGIAFIN